MSTLTKIDQKVLEKRGIFAQSGASVTEITFTTTGISWLFNYLHSSGNVGATLTLALLKEVVKFQPINSSWRALRFQIIPIPVYDTDYLQLIFYLEGSPPKAFHAFAPNILSVPKIFDVPVMECGVFKIRNDQFVRIEFSNLEVEQLADKKQLRVVETA